MSTLGDHGMDMPFEENPEPAQLGDEHFHLAGGMVVASTTGVDVPEVGRCPALLFRFMQPHGEFYPPMLLVLDDDQMAKLGPLVTAAIETARRAAL